MSELCGYPVRGLPGETCKLDPDHRGSHSWRAFICDGCGKRRRGVPYVDDHETGLGFCFLCCGPPAKRGYDPDFEPGGPASQVSPCDAFGYVPA